MKLSEIYLCVLQVFKASPSRYLNEGFKKTFDPPLENISLQFWKLQIRDHTREGKNLMEFF